MAVIRVCSLILKDEAADVLTISQTIENALWKLNFEELFLR